MIASIDEIVAAREAIADFVNVTPVIDWHKARLESVLGPDCNVSLKLETMQRTGTFKSRGALTAILALPEGQKEKGVLAASAGNHAIGVAYAAQCLSTEATVFMPSNTDEVRFARAEAYGARVVRCDDMADAYRRLADHQNASGGIYVHQFEGPDVVMGSATLGLEWFKQSEELEAIVVPVGGGGLIAGIASAFRLCNPDIAIYGVEPENSNVIGRFVASGTLETLDDPRTIADSLNVSKTEPYTASIVAGSVDQMFTVTESEIVRAMGMLFDSVKLAVEPAGAVATAGLVGPIAPFVEGKRVGVLVCGTNIDRKTFATLITKDPNELD